MNYFFSEEELAFNASLDAWDLLLQMGFNENSLYREGQTIRLFCPLHKDQIRRSMVVYTDRNTYKCQYMNCEGHKGGNMLELYSAYMGVDLPDVMARIKNQGSSGNDLVERADKMVQEGNLVDALPLLQKAVQLDPTHEITRCRLAALYLELGDKEAGYKEYMTAAEHFGVRGELDKTLNIYSILVFISPDDVKVRKQLSYLYSRLKRQDAAVAELKWVVDRHVRKGELSDAAHICKKMIELCPEYPDSHRILGEILLKQGNYFDAVDELKTAATHYIRENNLKKSKETVDLGLRFMPGNPQMKELRTKIEKAIELKAQATEQKDEREQEFESWLRDLKSSIGIVEAAPEPVAAPAPAAEQRREPAPPAAPAAKPLLSGKFGTTTPLPRQPTNAPGIAPAPAPARQQPPAAAMPASGIKAHIAPDDQRIQMFRDNLSGRTEEQVESLRRHIVSMFTDVQNNWHEASLTEFEVNVIREFYEAFCIALDAHRSGQQHAARA